MSEEPAVTPGRRKLAVALKYEPKEDKAPKVVAAGKGLIAEKILEEAGRLACRFRKMPASRRRWGPLKLGGRFPRKCIAQWRKCWLSFIVCITA